MEITHEHVMKLLQLAMLCGFAGALTWELFKLAIAHVFSVVCGGIERAERKELARLRAQLKAQTNEVAQ